MLEVLFLAFLCKKNAENAYACGAPANKYKLITVLLWFGGEIFGMILGLKLGLGRGAYVPALLLAAGGGYLSNYLSKNAH